MSLSEHGPANEALGASEERYRRMVETAEEGIWLLDQSWKTTFVNARMSQMLDWPPEHMPGRHFFDFMDEEGRQLALDKLALGERGARMSLEVRFIRRDGRELWTLLALSPITDEAGQFAGALAMVTDITERRLLEGQLRQAQKMEAMGQLAGGVAHDFNNILTSFIMNIYVLKKDPSLAGPARELLADIESDAKRAANLTRQLLLFSRRQALQFKPLEINETVTNLLKMLRRLLGEHIAMDFQPAGQALWVEADVGMIEQVLVNLCINARDAMPTGGQLRLDTRPVDLDEAAARRHAEARPGRFVRVSVADTGSGMNETMLKRVFEPFFTTKEEGKGTGLGLATVYGIVKQHHGWVEVASAVQAGTVFRVFLPAGAPAGSQSAAASPLPLPVGGHETILLVEDEPVVRQTVTVCLRQYGYTILAAQDGGEALALWERHRAAVNLLFTDMVMPGGMSGIELAERLKRERPGLKVIVGSGYSELMARQGIPNHPGFTFLPKPYEPEPLLAGVRKALDAK